MSQDRKNWYDNKELFEMILSLKSELKETREIVKRYNNLYEKQKRQEGDLLLLQQEIREKENKREGQIHTWELIRGWTPWVITVFALLYAYFSGGF